MTNSRNRNRRAPLGLALLAALSVGAAAATAQTTTLPAASTGAPIELLPGAASPGTPSSSTSSSSASPSSAGTSVTPLGTAPTVGSPGGSSSDVENDSRAPAGIQVERIGASEGYGGTLEAADGGLGIDMWRGTDRATAEALLADLPAPVTSPGSRELVRRMLLSSAEAPIGSGARSLYGLRAERLRALGNLDDMKAFLAVLPRDAEDAAGAALRLDLAWLAGDNEAACTEAQGALLQFPGDIDLQKAQAFCQASGGHVKESQLAAGLLREQGVKDEAFFALLDAVNGYPNVAVPSDAPPSPLGLAMLAKAGLPLPASWTDGTDPAILAWIAKDEGRPVEERLLAGERAFAAGAIDADKLVQIYRAVPNDPGAVDRLLTSNDDKLDPVDRALFFQAANGAQQPQRRAQILHRLLELARIQGGYPAAVAVDLDMLLQMTPSPDLAWFAADAGRAFYLAGRYERAGAWQNIARLRAANDRDAAAAVQTLALLEQIAGGAEPLVWAPDAVTQWRDAQAAAGDPDAAVRAARLFAVLAALGEPVGETWRQVAGEPGLVDPRLGQLERAVAEQRRAEAVALAAILLGPNGPSDAHPLLVHAALSALRGVGLESEARSLALETVVGSGI